MANTPTVYVICDANCKWESMTREQILTAITQAVSTGEIGDINTGFVQTIKTINGVALKFFVGEQAEYELLSEEDKKDLFAIITNDTTKDGITNAINNLQTECDELRERVDGLTLGGDSVAYAEQAGSARYATTAETADVADQLTAHLISANSEKDLNNYLTSGLYYCLEDIVAATLTNCPTKNAFSMQIYESAGILQEITEYLPNRPKKYLRNIYMIGESIIKYGTWKEIITEWNIGDQSVSHATSADRATSANVATSANTATEANHAASADYAESASYADEADKATEATKLVNGSVTFGRELIKSFGSKTNQFTSEAKAITGISTDQSYLIIEIEEYSGSTYGSTFLGKYRTNPFYAISTTYSTVGISGIYDFMGLKFCVKGGALYYWATVGSTSGTANVFYIKAIYKEL